MQIRVRKYDVLLDVLNDRTFKCRSGISCLHCFKQYLTCHASYTPCGIRRWSVKEMFVTPDIEPHNDLPF